MSNFSDDVVQGLVGKLRGLKLTGEEQELLNHLIDVATSLSDEQLDGAAGGAPGQQPIQPTQPGGGPMPRGRLASPGPDMPGGGPAGKLRRG